MRIVVLSALLAAGAPASAGVFDAPELLAPQQAFRLSARALDTATIELTFNIADGYYMYRDRFKFTTVAGKPVAADIPRGQMKDDPYFGPTEILRREARIRLPVPAGTKKSIAVDVTSQGCADQGVCFLPQTQRVRVSLPGRKE